MFLLSCDEGETFCAQALADQNLCMATPQRKATSQPFNVLTDSIDEIESGDFLTLQEGYGDLGSISAFVLPSVEYQDQIHYTETAPMENHQCNVGQQQLRNNF